MFTPESCLFQYSSFMLFTPGGAAPVRAGKSPSGTACPSCRTGPVRRAGPDGMCLVRRTCPQPRCGMIGIGNASMSVSQATGISKPGNVIPAALCSASPRKSAPPMAVLADKSATLTLV